MGSPGPWNEAAVCCMQTPAVARWPAVSNCPQVPTIQSPRPLGIWLCSVGGPHPSSPSLGVFHSLLPSPFWPSSYPSTPPSPLAPSPLPPLPASLPASFSARLQLGDNLPHLASRLLPRLIAQLVPGARPSFFPTPHPQPCAQAPSAPPCFSHPFPGDQLPLTGRGSRVEGNWPGPKRDVSKWEGLLGCVGRACGSGRCEPHSGSSTLQLSRFSDLFIALGCELGFLKLGKRRVAREGGKG